MGVTAHTCYHSERAILEGSLTIAAGLKVVLCGVTGWTAQNIADLNYYSNITGDEIAPTGDYVVGGLAMIMYDPTTINSPRVGRSGMDSVTFTGLTAIVKYAVLYNPGTDEIISVYDLEDTGGSLNLTADSLVIYPATGTAFELASV